MPEEWLERERRGREWEGCLAQLELRLAQLVELARLVELALVPVRLVALELERAVLRSHERFVAPLVV